jgi:hypothetical protein
MDYLVPSDRSCFESGTLPVISESTTSNLNIVNRVELSTQQSYVSEMFFDLDVGEFANVDSLSDPIKGTSLFWREMRRIFIMLDSKGRGQRWGVRLSGEDKFHIAFSTMFNDEHGEQLISDMHLSEQRIRDLRTVLYSSAIYLREFSGLIQFENMDRVIPVSVEQLQVVNALVKYESERSRLTDVFLDEEVQRILENDGMGFISQILQSYQQYLTVEPLLSVAGIDLPKKGIGEFNKIVGSFMMGRDIKGIAKLSKRISLGRWLETGVGTEQFQYNSIILQSIENLFQYSLPDSDKQSGLYKSARHFFQEILQLEYKRLQSSPSTSGLSVQNEKALECFVDRDRCRLTEANNASTISSLRTFQTFRDNLRIPSILYEIMGAYSQNGMSIDQIVKMYFNHINLSSTTLSMWVSAGINLIDTVLSQNERVVTWDRLKQLFTRDDTKKVRRLFKAIQSANVRFA